MQVVGVGFATLAELLQSLAKRLRGGTALTLDQCFYYLVDEAWDVCVLNFLYVRDRDELASTKRLSEQGNVSFNTICCSAMTYLDYHGQAQNNQTLFAGQS